MSNPLTDHTDAQDPIRFSTMWRAMAIAGFGMLSFITMGFLTWGGWVTVSIISHGEAIAAFKGWQGNGVSQNVNVGEVKDADKPLEASAKTWLTTKDVAAREGITERTVINYIENGMIEPTPRKNGKSWEIAANFRIIPNDSENCGDIPQGP
jgi:hypothetical protein